MAVGNWQHWPGAAGGGGTPWTPSQLSTVEAWYDADAITGISSGSDIGTWPDSSGNGYVPTSFGGSIYTTNVQNGLPAVVFDGTGNAKAHLANTNILSGASDVWMYMVGDIDNSLTPQPVCVTESTGTSSTLVAFHWRSTGALWFRYNGSALANTSATGYASPGWKVTGFRTQSSTLYAYQDGSALTLSNPSITNPLPTQTASALMLGDRSGGTTDSLGEVIIGVGVLSDADRERIDGYLAHKWGLTANLPPSHPYKSSPPTVPSSVQASGGVESTAGGYTYHTFTSSGTFTVTTGGNVEYLIVGGGGGGGKWYGAGGGAGGLLSGTTAVNAQAYTITVGSGGAGQTSNYGLTWDGTETGGDSVAFGLTAYGGGPGGSNNRSGQPGGSGGGGGPVSGGGNGGAGTAGQGNNGGGGVDSSVCTYGPSMGAGGGGGAGAVGGTGTCNAANQTNGGSGGAGVEWPSGSGNYYAGGGGGSANQYNINGGSGGIGGGGDGGNNTTLPTAGTANTGGGGGGFGGNGSPGGDGGSGIVIIRY